MDDVEDSSDLRRGIPVAHKIYGVPQTINTANYVYFLALRELYVFRELSPIPQSQGTKGKEPRLEREGFLDQMITGESISISKT
jgi:geranylgeranyl diphosphate synthase type 3